MSAEPWLNDKDDSWSDEHLLHVLDWLRYNEQSPWKEAPGMLLAAMQVPPEIRSSILRQWRKREFFFRIAPRIKFTKHLKQIVNGEIIPTIERRNGLGKVIKYSFAIATDPVPYPIPPFLKPRLVITNAGPRLAFDAPASIFKPNGEGRSRLLNPFGLKG